MTFLLVTRAELRRFYKNNVGFTARNVIKSTDNELFCILDAIMIIECQIDLIVLIQRVDKMCWYNIGDVRFAVFKSDMSFSSQCHF